MKKNSRKIHRKSVFCALHLKILKKRRINPLKQVKHSFVNYDYKIAPNIINLAVARPSMAVGRGTGGSPPVPLQTTPTNPGEFFVRRNENIAQSI